MQARRTLVEWALLAMLLMSAGYLAVMQDWFWRPDLMLYDAALSIKARPAPDDIVIVAIDEESLARIGRWPWPRAIHATLIERLTEAKAAAVGLDIILNEADRKDPDSDRVLAGSIRRNGRVVLPVVQRVLGPGLISAGTPAPVFAAAAAGLGHIDMTLDADGIARRVDLWAGDGPARYPQLGLALLDIVQPDVATRYALPADNAPATAGWWRIAPLHLPFAGPPGTFHAVSYVDVLTGEVPVASLRDKIVLVGATATGLGDIYPTPMASLGSSMPGVEIHANAIDAVRSGGAVAWLPRHQAAMVTVSALLLLLLALMHLSPRGGLLASTAMIVAAVIGSLLLMREYNLWLSPMAFIVASLLAYPLWSWRRLEAAQRFMDAELQQLRETEPGLLTNQETAARFDPIEHRIAIVRAATERQRAIHRERDETMRFLSHDLRSPLVSIVTLVEGASEQLGDDCRTRLGQTGIYAQRALELADDFFRLARAEAADPRQFKEVDLAAIVMDAADDAWALAKSKDISLIIENECTDDALAIGDRSLLHRAALNLIGNAVKFSPAGSPIRIILRKTGEYHEIAIVDQGCGIPADQMNRLFTRFGRIANPDVRPQSGVGLGLFIVKTIIERHGGHVGATSTAGQGATFFLRLPVASTETPAVAGGNDI